MHGVAVLTNGLIGLCFTHYREGQGINERLAEWKGGLHLTCRASPSCSSSVLMMQFSPPSVLPCLFFKSLTVGRLKKAHLRENAFTHLLTPGSNNYSFAGVARTQARRSGFKCTNWTDWLESGFILISGKMQSGFLLLRPPFLNLYSIYANKFKVK